MDEREQCVVIKFFRLQEQVSKAIHTQVRGTRGDIATSLPTLKRCLRRFMEMDTFYED
jgi:hypothetical protein